MSVGGHEAVKNILCRTDDISGVGHVQEELHTVSPIAQLLQSLCRQWLPDGYVTSNKETVDT